MINESKNETESNNSKVIGLSALIVQGIATSIDALSVGFTIVIYVYATIRERLEIADVPESFKGTPIALITAGLMACAIAGIAGLV